MSICLRLQSVLALKFKFTNMAPWRAQGVVVTVPDACYSIKPLKSQISCFKAVKSPSSVGALTQKVPCGSPALRLPRLRPNFSYTSFAACSQSYSSPGGLTRKPSTRVHLPSHWILMAPRFSHSHTTGPRGAEVKLAMRLPVTWALSPFRARSTRVLIL